MQSYQQTLSTSFLIIYFNKKIFNFALFNLFALKWSLGDAIYLEFGFAPSGVFFGLFLLNTGINMDLTG